ncbi:hypothetical protein TGRUB_229005 [Toxoplasma gondii RUB]|uniref:Uncharacterized protein n=1 Tax=Toxoplasma gondii RUB TaxID=935652 RepID=A0A086M3I9_TOXGO|nr:hypothetical protein TGRUB_229005 [Toxoplasma gondii RUB]
MARNAISLSLRRALAPSVFTMESRSAFSSNSYATFRGTREYSQRKREIILLLTTFPSEYGVPFSLSLLTRGQETSSTYSHRTRQSKLQRLSSQVSGSNSHRTAVVVVSGDGCLVVPVKNSVPHIGSVPLVSADSRKQTEQLPLVRNSAVP